LVDESLREILVRLHFHEITFLGFNEIFRGGDQSQKVEKNFGHGAHQTHLVDFSVENFVDEIIPDLNFVESEIDFSVFEENGRFGDQADEVGKEKDVN
jgi:hypothetical protein